MDEYMQDFSGGRPNIDRPPDFVFYGRMVLTIQSILSFCF